MRSVLRRSLRQWRRNESGAVAVEFAIIAPLLFAMLFGIVVVGYAMALSHSVNQLAGSAARASVAGLTQGERRDLAQAYLDEAATHYPLLVQDAIRPTLTLSQTGDANITVAIAYDLDGSMLSLANGFLGLDLSELRSEAYLAY